MNTCERCGKAFGCGLKNTERPCWCTAVPKLRQLPEQYKDCLCPECLALFTEAHDVPATHDASGNTLVEGEDYYLERGLFVFTAKYLSDRGYCCNSNCRHCPWK